MKGWNVKKIEMFFSGMAWYVSIKNFRFHSTALQFLCNKCHILIIFGKQIFFLKNICSFTPVIKISSKSDQKGAKTRHLLLKMFKYLNDYCFPIVHWMKALSRNRIIESSLEKRESFANFAADYISTFFLSVNFGDICLVHDRDIFFGPLVFLNLWLFLFGG